VAGVSAYRLRRLVVGGVNAGGNIATGRRGCVSEVEEKFFSPSVAGENIWGARRPRTKKKSTMASWGSARGGFDR
jgi:hypothetical protein